MARILGIDYGTRRCGLATTDPLQIIPGGLCAVETPKLMNWLKAYLAEEDVEAIVVGYPLDSQDRPTDATPHVDRFIARLRKAFPTVAVHTEDERGSSQAAVRALIDSGVRKKARRNKALVDEVSAVIILQQHLENRH
jgi:putative Holliday junction resolvase